MDLRIAQSALGDLQAIQAYYTEQDVPNIGNECVIAILEHCEMLQRHPDAGFTRHFELSTSDRPQRLCS